MSEAAVRVPLTFSLRVPLPLPAGEGQGDVA
jgi:hypothetical protein